MGVHRHDFIAKADQSKVSEVDALARKLEPQIAQAVRDVLRAHADSIDLDALAEAVGKNDQNRIWAIIGAVDPVRAAAIKTALENTVWAGGASAGQLPVFVEAQFAFNRLNPELVNWLQGYSLNLIRSIDDGTKEAVRSALVSGMSAGRNPIDQARRIKEAVGLTPGQARAVANYRKELETFHTKRSAKSWGLKNERSRMSGVEVNPRDKQGKSLDGIHQRRLRDQRFDATLERAMVTKVPLKPAQIDKMVARYQERYIARRAQTIARTESIRAINAGVNETWRQAIAEGKIDGNLVRKQWRVSPGCCPICESIPKANPKRGVRMEQAFKVPDHSSVMLPPMHPNCFPAGTLVSAGARITNVMTRWYDGEAVVVSTASGKELTGTINHPVLSQRGWVPLGELDEGDSLIRCLTPQSIRLGDHDEQGPTPIEEVARAALQSGAMTSAEVPITAEHFHGDATDGDVAIVSTYGRLQRAFTTMIIQKRDHAALKNALRTLAQAALSCLRDAAAMIFGVNQPSACGVCGGDLRAALTFTHPGPFDGLGLPQSTHGHATFDQEAAQSRATDAKLARELLEGRAFDVARDEIVAIRRITLRDHVFNLETESGHYNANGFVVHNCRCSIQVRLWTPIQLLDEAA